MTSRLIHCCNDDMKKYIYILIRETPFWDKGNSLNLLK